MAEMTPRQRLEENLRKNAEYIEREWNDEIRAAISTAKIFEVRPEPRAKRTPRRG